QAGNVAFAVAMGNFPFQDVTDNFHIAVTVGRKPGARHNFIVVDHPQGGKAHEAGIVITAKRKRMTTVEPVKMATAAFFTASYCNHGSSPVGGDGGAACFPAHHPDR